MTEWQYILWKFGYQLWRNSSGKIYFTIFQKVTYDIYDIINPLIPGGNKKVTHT